MKKIELWLTEGEANEMLTTLENAEQTETVSKVRLRLSYLLSRPSPYTLKLGPIKLEIFRS